MHTNPPLNREGYSPAEFARSLGKHPTYIYRLLYAGKLKAVTQFGRLLIPRSEIDRMMATATTYNPKPKKRRAEQAAEEEAN